MRLRIGDELGSTGARRLDERPKVTKEPFECQQDVGSIPTISSKVVSVYAHRRRNTKNRVYDG